MKKEDEQAEAKRKEENHKKTSKPPRPVNSLPPLLLHASTLLSREGRGRRAGGMPPDPILRGSFHPRSCSGARPESGPLGLKPKGQPTDRKNNNRKTTKNLRKNWRR